MRKLLTTFCAVLLIVGMASFACGYEFTDTYTPTPNGDWGLQLNTGDSDWWLFDITPEYVPGVHTLTDAWIYLTVYNFYAPQNETAQLELALSPNPQQNYIFYPWDGDNMLEFQITVSLPALADDGILYCELTSLSGNFWFNKADLVAHATPEPGTMLLLGFGLLGLVGLRRKA